MSDHRAQSAAAGATHVPRPSTDAAAPTSPPPNRRQLVVILGCVLLLLGAGVSLPVIGLWRYANADHLGILDNPPVADRAAQACATMAREVAAIPPAAPGDTAGQVTVIRAQNQALEHVVTSMTDLGPELLSGDHPANQWIADWKTLIQLREDYADALAAGSEPTFEVPTVDGYPITHRMSESGVECPIPPEITALP